MDAEQKEPDTHTQNKYVLYNSSLQFWHRQELIPNV